MLCMLWYFGSFPANVRPMCHAIVVISSSTVVLSCKDIHKDLPVCMDCDLNFRIHLGVLKSKCTLFCCFMLLMEFTSVHFMFLMKFLAPSNRGTRNYIYMIVFIFSLCHHFVLTLVNYNSLNKLN